MYWRWTKTRLAPQNTHPCHDQVLDGRFVPQRTMLAIGGDGAADQTRIRAKTQSKGTIAW